MTIYLLNSFSVLVYAAVDYAMRVFNNSSHICHRKTTSPSGASPFLFSVLILQETLFLGLRSPSIGVDTERYTYVFKNCLVYDFDYEPGFLAFISVLRHITANEQIFLLVTATISIVPIGILLFRLSQMPYLSWMVYIGLFYYTFTFSGIRQSIAMALLTVAFYCLYKKKYFWGVMWTLLAASFHKSALIFLLAVFFRNHKWKIWEIPVLVLSYICIFLFRSPLFHLITMVFYEEYEQVETDAYTWMIVNVGLYFALLLISFFLKKQDRSQFPLTLLSIGCAFMLMTPVGTNVLRVANYFCIFFTLAIPEVLQAASKKYRFWFVFAGIFVLQCFYIYHLSRNPYSIIEYQFGSF